ncbi:MAG: adenosine deaminase, partial [Clostridia bacterium]|nr:adenosine deaminase [Clostridia bacterium]
MRFGCFSLDKEKDILVELSLEDGVMRYCLRTPNHATGNLITNLARLCALPLTLDANGLYVICGEIPCYVDEKNREVFVFRLGDTKVANIYPDGVIERKAYIPAISKTLMSQTKDYQLDLRKTLVKTYILRDCKFRTDLHTHMNANLDPDILIALGIHHQIRYPLYYVKKLSLHLTSAQEALLQARRENAAKAFASSDLKGKYLDRKIDDNTFINFADLILSNPDSAAFNIARIRASLAIMKDGQAVFTNLEKVYLYRYVFTKGAVSEDKLPELRCDAVPDNDIRAALRRMEADSHTEAFADLPLYENTLLWIARSLKSRGIVYAEISDTRLTKPAEAAETLARLHRILPAITKETGVVLRFLAAVRRIPLTIVKDQIALQDSLWEQIRVIRAIAADPYIAGSDIIGEEMNDIRDLRPVIAALTHIASGIPGFVVRIHAGENDSLRDNVLNSIRCVRESLAPGEEMPAIRIGHGLYTANLRSKKGMQLIRELRESGAVLEFQITSNVRLNNLSRLENHPLKQYLAAGIPCVQGTDGGAIYGTDSIDEQLALERLLDLTHEELL